MIKTPLNTVIGGAFLTPNSEILGSTTETPDQTIELLFTNGEQGFYYDPNDLSTMYQDVAGTIPVTAVGQTVARINDKSGNGHHLVQATVSRQPKLIQDSVTFKYGLLWDGVDDHMEAPFSISADIPDAVLGIAVSGTVANNMPFAMGISDTQTSDTNGRGMFLIRSKETPRLRASNTMFNRQAESFVLATTRHSALAVAYAGDRYKCVYNDTTVIGGVAGQVSQAIAFNNNISMFKIGCNNMTACQTFKMFGILRKLTEAEITEVNTILKSEVGGFK